MSEMENGPVVEKPKISKLAIASLLLVILGCFVFSIESFKIPYLLRIMNMYIYVFFILNGFVLGIIADNQIYKSKGKYTGRIFSILGTGLALILVFLIIIKPPITSDLMQKERISQGMCHSSLSLIGKVLQIYNNKHGQYPTPDKWCDLLINPEEYDDVFFYHGAILKNKKGLINYAINPNCRRNSSPNTVLLFEIKGGRNQYGGPELLTAENHNGKGCNVFFKNGHIEFINKEDFGKLKLKD